MTVRLSIHKRLLIFSVMAVCFVLMLGAVGHEAVRRLSDTRDAITESVVAMKSQMQADMMHDALRADVLRALLAGSRRDAAAQPEVTRELAEHLKDFRESLAALDQAGVDAEIRAAATQVRPALEAYAKAATDVVGLAWSDNERALTQWPAFQAAFTSLEGAMEKLGDLVERNAKAQREASEGTSVWARRFIVGAVVLAAVIMVGVGSAIGRRVSRPLQEAVRMAEAVAAGDLCAHAGAGSAAQGHDEIAQLMAALATMNESLSRIVGRVRDGSDSIATGSGEIASGNGDLSRRTEQQAASLQQTAASMEQINSAVQSSTAAARRAHERAATAREAAARGGEVVGRVTQTMAEISEGSRRIAEITGVIDGIAFQTNILALNAAVEAARAGEHGRGFAVVASEVRALAQRSAQAAREIKALIGRSVEQVEQGATLAQDAGRAIADIVTEAERVDALIGEISHTAGEQGRGFEQINAAMHELDRTTQQNAAAVEETAAAAESLRRQSQDLAELVRVFRLA